MQNQERNGVESQEAFPTLGGESAHLEESYDILSEGLQEFLADPQRWLETGETNYLEAVRDKVRFAAASVEEDLQSEVLQVEKEAYASVQTAFAKYYEGLFNEEALAEVPDQVRINLIYRLFFGEKREFLLDGFVMRALRDRKRLVAAFKGGAKKDILTSQIRTEYGSSDFVRDPSNLYLVASYNEVFEEFLVSPVDLNEFFLNLELNYDQCMFLDELLSVPDPAGAYERFVSGISDTPVEAALKNEFRERLIKALDQENNEG
jgi:hypothetical protein